MNTRVHGSRFTVHARSGQALLIALLTLFLVLALAALFTQILLHHLDTATDAERRRRAQTLAEAGLEAAVQQLDRGDGLARPRPFPFAGSWPGGRFEGWVEDVPGPSVVRVTVTGTESEGGKRRTVQVYVTDPTPLLRAVRSVYHISQFPSATLGTLAVAVSPQRVDFGSRGVAVNALRHELHLLPADGRVTVRAVRDPVFAGMVPGSDAVVGADGRVYERAVVVAGRLVAGTYQVNPAAGTVQFSPADAGQAVSLHYDYFRRVPLPPGPYRIDLTPAPLQASTEQVRFGWEAFWRDRVYPRLQNHYFVDPGRGFLLLSQHNTFQPLQVHFRYLGTRITGPVRINGSVRWHGTNELYLFAGRGDRMVVSGGYEYAPGAAVRLFSERGEAVHPQSERHEAYRDRAAVLRPPPLVLAAYRRLADRGRGGSGLYFPNFADRQERRAVVREWLQGSGPHWSEGVYIPPGVVLDLPQVPDLTSGVIYAEGNLRLRGVVRAGQRWTVVSGGTIYLEGSVWPADETAALALLARDHVCVNTTLLGNWETGLRSRGNRETGGLDREARPPFLISQWPNFPVSFYLHALVWAERGSLAAIPSGRGGREAVLRGALAENEVWPEACWAEAFDSIEWLYDPTFLDAARRPLHLAVAFDWQEARPRQASRLSRR